jgi:urease accessory protein
MNVFFWLISIPVWLLTAAPAFAHAPIQGVGGLVGGLLHPILVPAHALSLLALGLFIVAQRERRGALLIFAAALITGLLGIAFGVGQTPADIVLLANTFLLGVLVAAAWVPPMPIRGVLAGISGAALALDSPPDAISIEEGNLMLLGTALGAGTALAVILIVGSVLKSRWQRLGMRILGSWIAATAVLALTAAMMR